MKTNLLESITEQLTPQMVQRVGTAMGETPVNSQNAVNGAIFTLIAGLMHLAASENGPTRLVNLINHRNYGRLLNNMSGLLDEGNTAKTLIASGQDILSTLFTDKQSAVSGLIASASGVINSSAFSLLSLTAPVVVGVLGRIRTAQGLNAAGLTEVLMSQKDYISRQAPAGLAGIFGLNNLTDLGCEPAGTTTEMAPALLARKVTDLGKEESMLKQWRWPVLAAFTIGLLYFFMGRGVEVAQTPMVVIQASEDTPAVAQVTLPGETALSLKEGSFTYNVAKFLGDATTTTVPKTFVFDRLDFDSGTMQLTTASVQTVEDLLAILKAYHTADVRLDGYTDNIGDVYTNKKLSLERAVAVQETLIRGGIGATRVTTAGYGQEHPLVSNETEEGRAKNRRLELVVLKK
jgi:OOP family OmpA-OmpF porin